MPKHDNMISDTTLAAECMVCFEWFPPSQIREVREPRHMLICDCCSGRARRPASCPDCGRTFVYRCYTAKLPPGEPAEVLLVNVCECGRREPVELSDGIRLTRSDESLGLEP